MPTKNSQQGPGSSHQEYSSTVDVLPRHISPEMAQRVTIGVDFIAVNLACCRDNKPYFVRPQRLIPTNTRLVTNCLTPSQPLL
jgi:hypothetical protein